MQNLRHSEIFKDLVLFSTDLNICLHTQVFFVNIEFNSSGSMVSIYKNVYSFYHCVFFFNKTAVVTSV